MDTITTSNTNDEVGNNNAQNGAGQKFYGWLTLHCWVQRWKRRNFYIRCDLHQLEMSGNFLLHQKTQTVI